MVNDRSKDAACTRAYRALLVAALGLHSVACGDNVGAVPDATPPPCRPPHGPAFGGLLGDPLTIPLPDTCVDGGLQSAGGRWFVVDGEYLNSPGYPRIEGGCETGFRLTAHQDVSDDVAGFWRATWSDGTRLVVRDRYASAPALRSAAAAAPSAETVIVFAACLSREGSLSTVQAFQTSFDGHADDPIYINGTGNRFGHRAPLGGVVPLELVGTLGPLDGEPGNKIWSVRVDAGIAYTVGTQGLDVIDVSNPTAPRRVSHVDSAYAYEDIVLAHEGGRTIAFVAGAPTDIVDVTDAASPVVLRHIFSYAHRLYLRSTPTGPLLYLASTDATVPIFDVSDPSNPLQVGATLVPGSFPPVNNSVADVSADDNTIYVNGPSPSGFVALNVTAGFDMPTVSASLNMYSSYSHWRGEIDGRTLILHGESGLIGLPAGMAFLRVIDGDPSSGTYFTEIGHYQSRREVGIADHRASVVGTRAYVPYQQDGIRVLDLSRPDAPQEIAFYDTWDDETAPGELREGALSVDVVDGLVYVADSERGLLIFRDPP
jgi:hypothetical protein